MRPKPKHLAPEYGAQFQDRSIVDAYQHRSPYPAETFELLAALMTGERRILLDVGCGRGEIARNMLSCAARVDAVDPSAAMIATGKTLLGGQDTRLRWILGSAEDAPLEPPYALVTAGGSLHWMEWAVVLPRFRAALVPGGLLAIVDEYAELVPWHTDLLRLIARSSTNRDFQPYDLLEELTARGLFVRVGARRTRLVPFAQPVDDYIESIHSRNGFSRERMSIADAAAFDDAVRALVTPFAADGMLHLETGAAIVWGIPLDGDTQVSRAWQA
jgi:SAM-dependent methyltransferase